MQYSRLSFSICTCTLLALAALANAQPTFLSSAQVAAPRRTLEETAVRSRTVDVNFAVLHGMTDMTDRRLRFDLFDDVSPVGALTRREIRSVDSYTWTGKFENIPESSFYLVVHHDVICARIDLVDGGVFEIRSTPGGMHEVVEIDPAAFKPCGTGKQHAIPLQAAEVAETSPSPADPRGGASPRVDDGSELDVLGMYTTTAKNAAGGTNGIESLIILSISVTNGAYSSSQVNPRLRLVHMAETNYPETGNASLDLGRFSGTSDGFIDEVHSLRNTHGADLCALIVNSSDNCGIAYLMTSLSSGFQTLAFSVTLRTCASANLTLAHELGHNQGCQHDRDNADTGIYPYAYGHRFNAPNLKRTIMAYDPGERVNHFSNPNVLFNGVPTGVPIGQPLEAHNAQTINNTALTISQYRESIPVIDDFDPPQPDPLAFDSPPTAIDSTSITMTAAGTIDASLPVQHFFEETTGNPGGTTSGWQNPNSYVDFSLTPNMQYCYRVKARDSNGVPNEGAYSPAACIASHIQTPTGMAFSNVEYTTAQVTATGAFTSLNVGMSGIYFDVDPPGAYGGAFTWQQNNTAMLTGLMSGQSYTVRAKARNQDGIETPYGTSVVIETLVLFGDCNADGMVDIDGDVPCFVDALLGIDVPPGAIIRSDMNFDGFTDGLDVPEMIFCLTFGCN